MNMSLNKEQWIEMWNSVCAIEAQAKGLISTLKKQRILAEIAKLKKLIQEVIGQME